MHGRFNFLFGGSRAAMTLRPISLFFLLVLLSPFAFARPQTSDAPDPSQMDKKQLEATAKQLVSEGKALEKEGKLSEANDKYIDAEGYLSTKDALNGIDHIKDANEKQVQALLADAHQSYGAGKYSDCVEKLQ